MTGIDRKSVLAELEGGWLDGLEGERREEARRLLAELVADWAREADPQPDPTAVLGFQREELEGLGRGRDATGRLGALRTLVLSRRVDRLNAETFALGKTVLQGTAEDEDARRRGRVLLAEAEAIAPLLDELEPGPRTSAIRRDLGDAVMEALYAVERKAMSARLAREDGASGPQLRP